MAKPKNQPIGELQCPFAGCTEKALIYKYRQRSDDPKMMRFAGRLYCVCPRKHRCEDADYILDQKGAFWKDGKPPVKTSEKPDPAPVPMAPETSKAAPVPPVVNKPPAPPVAPVKKPASGWGFFR